MAYDAFVADAKTGGSVSSLQTQTNTGAAMLLAYLAAAPLIAAALMIVISQAYNAQPYAGFMGLYGAVVIIFFGGVRWGVVVMKPEGPTMRSLLGATAPLLLAFPLLLPLGGALWKFPAIMALTGVLLVDDLNATRRGSGAPAWYLSVRLPLTVLIELAFVIALAGMMR
ncbi:MAG: DUF3429 domain-containing protein [Alphaproteobacteria bacterium]|nr:DUF3429 domain-containing protein [Alphaproteobacteria bacterium]